MIPKFHDNLSSQIQKLTETVLFNSSFKSKDSPKVINDKVVISKKVANILLGNNDFRLIIKIHYNDKVGSHLIGGTDAMVAREVDDYFKEECNVLAGRLKKSFDENQINVGISIPLKTSGLDELFFDRKEMDKNALELSWEMSNDDNSLVVATFIEVIDYSSIDKIDFNSFSSKSDEDEEVEFF
jgi:hypothetical protein